LAVDTFRQESTDTSGKQRCGEVVTAKTVGANFFHAWLSIPSGMQVLTPQGKRCCGEVVSAEGIDSQDGCHSSVSVVRY